ncbi:MAG: hypothetical protein AVDCRST_MAG25-864 [uncultured Rubrobacteraceae bacterium]|uniref:Uncharacterized protein n=1 Tax=uncultured Rubrobacteraceae bacterium TaxID=349277 RepID=A0A6J4R5Z5_9ACTN|nr:MAG: hypothetical protein AVDCRST_MAG25-864 [uncultured Rubrobacteraceae bacterium]
MVAPVGCLVSLSMVLVLRRAAVARLLWEPMKKGKGRD